MRHMLVTMRQNFQNMRKSHRVADENMLGEQANGVGLPHNNAGRARHGWHGFSVICSIVLAPLSLLSCLSHPHTNATDGVWVSGDMARISEMNHLMLGHHPGSFCHKL